MPNELTTSQSLSLHEVEKEKFKDLCRNGMSLSTVDKKLFEKIGGAMKEFYKRDDPKKRAKLNKAERDLILSGMNTLSLDTKYHLIGATLQKDQSFAVEMAEMLEKEYKAQLPSEKALVQTAVLSYMQMLRASTMLTLNMDQSNFAVIYSKIADQAYRRFTTTLQLLSQMKNPPIKVNIKTENAFMAQNQQINTTSPSDHEIIKPQ